MQKLATMHTILIIAIFFGFAAFLNACASRDGSRREAMIELANARGFSPHIFHTQDFALYGQFRPGQGNILHVYVEGDGFAWRTRTQASTNPTPKRPVALNLAISDTSGAPVLYLARPCQYVQESDWGQCSPRYWTTARLAPKVIHALSDAISQAMKLAHTRQVALIGYSGGGGAAALLASQRQDVSFLGTVAGNLDIASFCSIHRVSPMNESLNPLDIAHKLKDLPQLHLAGSRDVVIPPNLVAGFCQASDHSNSMYVIEGLEHGGPWAEAWHSRMPHH